MDGLEGIISNAISEVGGGADSGDSGGGNDVGGSGDVGSSSDGVGGAPPATGEGTAEGSDGAGIPAATPSPADDAFAKEHGLLNKVGQRENRIPYNRVVKIAENAERKLVE